MDPNNYTKSQIYFHIFIIIIAGFIIFAYTQSNEIMYIILGLLILLSSIFNLLKAVKRYNKEREAKEQELKNQASRAKNK